MAQVLYNFQPCNNYKVLKAQIQCRVYSSYILIKNNVDFALHNFWELLVRWMFSSQVQNDREYNKCEATGIAK